VDGIVAVNFLKAQNAILLSGLVYFKLVKNSHTAGPAIKKVQDLADVNRVLALLDLFTTKNPPRRVLVVSVTRYFLP
jgi:hypothetical protein